MLPELFITAPVVDRSSLMVSEAIQMEETLANYYAKVAERAQKLVEGQRMGKPLVKFLIPQNC